MVIDSCEAGGWGDRGLKDIESQGMLCVPICFKAVDCCVVEDMNDNVFYKSTREDPQGVWLGKLFANTVYAS